MVQVFHQVHNRGGERVALDIQNGLQARGHDVRTIAVKRREPEAEFSKVDKDVQVFDDAAKGGVGSVVGVVKMLRHLAKTKPDALIIHTTGAGFTVAPFARMIGIEHRVLVHHNAIGTNQTGLWVPLEKMYGTTGMYTDIIFVSDRAHELISHWPDSYMERADVIFNGIELPAPSPALTRESLLAEHDLPADTMVAVSVGSLEAQKNHKVLVEALNGVRGVHLFIAGEGSKRPDLERQIAQVNAPVTLLGNIDMSKVSALFHQSDILLFPSIHEGRALTLLEAADAGIGIIASSIPENVSVLGEDAAYVDPHDSAGWKTKVEELLADRSLLDERRAHTATLHLPTLDEMIDGYEDLICGS